MLPDFNVPTLSALLTAFRPCFTAPGYRTFTALVVGLIGQARRRTVCGMLLGAVWVPRISSMQVGEGFIRRLVVVWFAGSWRVVDVGRR